MVSLLCLHIVMSRCQLSSSAAAQHVSIRCHGKQQRRVDARAFGPRGLRCRNEARLGQVVDMELVAYIRYLLAAAVVAL
jgi:hypothetical protein